MLPPLYNISLGLHFLLRHVLQSLYSKALGRDDGAMQ